MICVLDASVLVALCIPQPATDASITFLENFLAQDDAALLAPDCIFYETTATLRKYERQGIYRGLDEDLLSLYNLPITSISCRDLMRAAAAISREHVLSPYDAFYLALAQREDAPLITADERLVNGTKGKGFDVRNVMPA
ncbi:MAG: type II toxin-antitoxin system VapC family toxin [Anaerolineae bacterium]|nr:type II toxin-antitoxin system VapC family toxin [Candidatus Roseilinea sp.]MDW8448815.1 type II toxin-antitoxin system VapC family toxin [Anaerolineae bacterium]